MTLILTLGVYLAGGLSLWGTRRILDGAYFRKHLRAPWIARILHIPTWAAMLFYTMAAVTIYTGFPVTGFQPGNAFWSSTYSIWNLFWFGSLLFSIPATITVWGAPLALWAFTQRIPEKGTTRTRRTPKRPKAATKEDHA